MVAIQSSFIRQLIQSDFSVPRRRFQDGERVIAGIHQMKPILRGLDSVGTREGEASSAVLIWIAPTLLEPDFAANRQDSRTMKPKSDKGRPTKALATTAMSMSSSVGMSDSLAVNGAFTSISFDLHPYRMLSNTPST